MTRNDEIALFWSRVDRRGPDECWPWTAGKNPNGYGAAYLTFGGKRRQIGAHRAALLLTKGPPSSGEYVLHSCDNRLCCNPAHLRYGSQRENVQDTFNRGRTNWNPRNGEDHPFGSLTEEEARRIIRLHMAGENVSQISKAVGHSEYVVADVCRGRSWRHIHGTKGVPMTEEIRRGGVRRDKLSDSDKAEILRMIAEGKTIREIAPLFGVSTSPIANLRKHGKTWVPKV